MEARTVFTIGHSTHESDAFVELLTTHDITAVADVRSVPASKFNPQFNRDALKRTLKERGIEYVFLGDELGARSDDPDCYVDGTVQYARLARTTLFHAGIDRLLHGSAAHRVAVMCTEKDPLDCHRTLLVAHHLWKRNVPIQHILSDATTETHEQTLLRMRSIHGLDEPDLLHSDDDLLAAALERQEARIAYVDEYLKASG